jgi:hypothetical protein
MGIAIKNENSAVADADKPIAYPPRNVEPDRDVPGISERV